MAVFNCSEEVTVGVEEGEGQETAEGAAPRLMGVLG